MNKMEMSDQADTPPDIEPEQLCPYFSSPFPNCYCVNMTSLDIPFVLKYCHGAQSNCKIYLSNRLLN